MVYNIGDITDGITTALRTAYPQSQIHTEKVVQGLKEPAFIVRLVSTARQSVNKTLRRQTPRYSIAYIPKDGLNECAEVMDRLFEIMETVRTAEGAYINGHDMSGEIRDNTLYFNVAMSHNILLKPEEILMEDIKLREVGQ